MLAISGRVPNRQLKRDDSNRGTLLLEFTEELVVKRSEVNVIAGTEFLPDRGELHFNALNFYLNLYRDLPGKFFKDLPEGWHLLALPGVQSLELGESHVIYLVPPVCRARNIYVVDDDNLPISGLIHVQFNPKNAKINRFAKRKHSIFGELPAPAAVGNDCDHAGPSSLGDCAGPR